MSDNRQAEIYRDLLQVLQARIDQFKVKSPGEAERFFLSKISETNPIKELLLLQLQGEEYQSIERRLCQMLKDDIDGRINHETE
jgi:hypothetical protein